MLFNNFFPISTLKLNNFHNYNVLLFLLLIDYLYEIIKTTKESLKIGKYTQKVSRKKIEGDAEAHLIALSCSKPGS